MTNLDTNSIRELQGTIWIPDLKFYFSEFHRHGKWLSNLRHIRRKVLFWFLRPKQCGQPHRRPCWPLSDRKTGNEITTKRGSRAGLTRGSFLEFEEFSRVSVLDFSFNTFSLHLKSQLLEGLVWKPCHENNGAAIYVGRAATLHNLLF